ncbi:penicillin-binding protein 2 [Alkalihalophilus marmarensis]|jgi:cell division protein FtsI/penicillin-binding protein 2|uniref:serine-type D-Ala-D-Ala carboxypeptidase n=1 Tax=Alkalihalophilus marmarensis DSM 21297 TaxID=1188261 RepID=U6SVV5_9BACI|nr:penicillin-binding protein 2 [Alkalihalophilus marmarensis]ERN54806.1 penicillin-binding protein 2A [Alkalihalophilus marmarensis DSM 21297]MCM3488575.1 penicillin-binding protein 2 [Alkalihalophilus marmarensis]
MGKNKPRKKGHVPARLNMLFFAVFILFSALILRLGMVQIVQGEDFERVLDRTSNTTARIDAPRGLMLDRYGTPVVENQLELSVTYTNPSRQTSSETILEVARDLEKLIEVDTSRITERDRMDFWLLINSDRRYELVTKEERAALDGPTEEYQLELERITEDHLAELTTEDERVMAIFREMSRGYANTPQRIKRGITEEEANIISENLDQLPGVDILRDSRRNYVFGEAFRTIFGSTGSIPREKLDYYLSRGYDRSDIVGTSYLELEYEDVLRGQKAVVESITTSTGGEIERSVNEKPGQRGNDLVLTLDMEMQQKLDNIISQEINSKGGSFISQRTAYAVMMDPKTGDILAMSGYSNGEPNDQIGNVTKAFEMGSSVKGASVLAGYQTGVISHGQTLLDRPIDLPGTPLKRSYTDMGYVNDIKALERSSNVYMFEIAMRMMGYNYGSSRSFDTQRVAEAYDETRYIFSQFGLGAETGIDLPGSALGYQGRRTQPGNLLDLMIGQYDTYTPLQLVQYVATIANDGYRVKPRLVSEIREPSLSPDEPGAILHKFEPQILNRVDVSDADLNRVQQGFYAVMNGSQGTGAGMFRSASYNPAGKTGTAQVRVQGIDGNNQILVGYAPYDNPEVAFAIIVPYTVRDNSANFAQSIGKKMLDEYFDLKEERNGPTIADVPILEEVED